MSKKCPSHYQTFDPVAKKMFGAAMKSLAAIYIDHTIANGRKYKRNFVKSIVNQA